VRLSFCVTNLLVRPYVYTLYMYNYVYTNVYIYIYILYTRKGTCYGAILELRDQSGGVPLNIYTKHV